MKIRLLDISGINSIGMAAAMPYQTEAKDKEKLAFRVWGSGHRSIARHSIITFEVLNISQDALRQLSRHPHINLTVKSTRYCDFKESLAFIPKGVDTDKYNKDFETIMDIYRDWQLQDKEDVAKQFLPLCSTTDLIMSGNVQAMYEFLQLRNCVRASEEINTMSILMTHMLSGQDGLIGYIFGELDCKGKEYGFCPEHKTCGKYPKK